MWLFPTDGSAEFLSPNQPVVHRITEDFNYFPVLGHKHDGLAFNGRDPYISISIQCDSVSTFKIGMRDKDVVETEGVGNEKLTTVTLHGSIKIGWANSAAAGTSSFGGKLITRPGMCMCIETESLS